MGIARLFLSSWPAKGLTRGLHRLASGQPPSRGRKRAVMVTGCDYGIGYSLALHAVRKGMPVIAACLNPNGPGATNLSNHPDLHVVGLDLTLKDSIRTARGQVEQLLEEHQMDLGGLVHNAAVLVFGESSWQTEQQVRSQLEVNVLGPIVLTREMTPALIKAKGRILVLVSNCAHISLPNLGPYSASKAGIYAWAESLRREMDKYGVLVSTLEPGDLPGDTNMFQNQGKNSREMASEMSQWEKDFYGKFFWKVHQHVMTAFPEKQHPRELKVPRLYSEFEKALLDKVPNAHYQAGRSRWMFGVFKTAVRLLPSKIGDRLVQRMSEMPKWP